MTIRKRRKAPPAEPIAGNGLLDRRMLLGRGIMFAGGWCHKSPPLRAHCGPGHRFAVGDC
jgi:hypothetical protein